MIKKYILYARTANVVPPHRVNSIENQLISLKKLARDRHLFFLRVIEERGVSGVSKKRAGLNLMLQMLEKGKAQGIICFDWSRLSRDEVTSFKILSLIRKKEIEIVTPKATYTNDAESQLMLTLLIGIHNYHRQAHSRAIKRGLLAKKLKG